MLVIPSCAMGLGGGGPCLTDTQKPVIRQSEKRKRMLRNQRREGFLQLWGQRLQGGGDTCCVPVEGNKKWVHLPSSASALKDLGLGRNGG